MEWLRRLMGWTRRREDALAEELDAHRAHVEDELRRSGFSAEDAALEARKRLGNVTLASEDAREAWSFRWLDQLRQHTRFGLRGLRREPIFSLTAILTLALGIAATTTVFSVVDAELWRPLPFPDPHRLVAVYSRAPSASTFLDGVSLDEIEDWRRAPGLASLAAESSNHWQTLQFAQAQSILVGDVTTNYFATLGRPALRGRLFTDEDAGGQSTAILTERGWIRVFDHAPDVVGRVVTLDGQPTTIVGIVADDDTDGPGAQLYLPIDERAPSAAARTFSVATGRLAAGALADATRAQIQGVIARRAAVQPDRRGHQAFVQELSAFYAPLDPGKLYFFLGASLLVLLLTVTNTAGLVLSRVLRRAPEFALRGALGGGNGALAMQLVVEAALVVIPGCLLGLWVAVEAAGYIGHVVPDDFLIRGPHIPVDLRVVACCGLIALIALAGLAVVPLGLAKRASASAIGAGGRTSAAPSAGRARMVLLTAQLALTVVLLAGGGLFLKSFVALLHVPLGFEPAAAWSASVELTGPRYADAGRRRAYGEAIIERARAVPGVQSAAVASSSPLNSGWLAMASDVRRPAPGSGEGLRTLYRVVSGDYFRTIGTPILRGRAIEASDGAGAPAVIVVNEQFARSLFPNEDPIGKVIALARTRGQGLRVQSGTATIVGVAADVRDIGLNEVKFADVYVPYAQNPSAAIELLVRGGAADGSMASALRAAAGAVDPTIPVRSTTPLTARVADSTKGARFNVVLVSGFATAAVLIAAIGLYGAMAYAAAARWREYGVRMALGATPRELVGRALWQAGRLGIMGGVIGISGALLFARWLGDSLYLVAGKHSGLLYGVTTTDPASLGGALVGVVVLALFAGAFPARRVARLDPVKALRAE